MQEATFRAWARLLGQALICAACWNWAGPLAAAEETVPAAAAEPAVVTTVPSVAGPSDAPWRVLVRVVDVPDADLAARVRGQVSDLGAQVREVPRSALEEGLRAQIEASRVLAAGGERVLVVWFVRGPSMLAVHVAQPGRERVLLRELPRVEDAASIDAQREAAALVVRSALRTVVAGAQIGVSEARLAPQPMSSAMEEEPGAAPPESERLSTAGPREWLRLQLSMPLRDDGFVSAPALDPGFALHYRRGPLSMGLSLALSPDRARTGDLVRVSLGRERLGLVLGVRAWQRQRWDLWLRGDLGWSLFHARPEALRAGVEPLPAPRFGQASGAALASMQWAAQRGTQRFLLGLSVGAEIGFTRVRIGYLDLGRFVETSALPVLQPRIALCIAWERVLRKPGRAGAATRSRPTAGVPVGVR